MEKLYKNIKETLVTEMQIKERIAELGKQITEDYNGEEVIVIGVLKGCTIFMSDLIRQIDLPLQIDFMVASSYGSDTKTSGNVKIIKDINVDVHNKHVMIVEDIIDTGLTMKNLKDIFSVRQCKSFKICTLLDKKERRKVEINADYIGFEVPDEFVVGYGLDYAGKYRNIPEICVLKPEVYAK